MTRRRWVTVGAVAAAALLAGLSLAALTSRRGSRQIRTTAAPTTTTEAPLDLPLVSLVPVPSGPPTTTTAARSTARSTTTASTAVVAARTTIAPSPVTLALHPCRAGDVSLGVTTDRRTYAPGDTVHIISTLTNATSTSCTAAPNPRGTSGPGTVCYPQVIVQGAFDLDQVPQYNGLLGPADGPCSPASYLVRAGGSMAVDVPLDFTASGTGYLHAGTWSAISNWELSDGTTLIATAAVVCPQPACPAGAPPSPTTTPSTSTTTSSSTTTPSSSTTTSTGMDGRPGPP